MRLLEGCNAVITGAGHGIGRAIARRFHEHGAAVTIADIDPDAAAEVAAALTGGATVGWARCDVTDDAQVAGLLDEATGLTGRLDIVVNNAGFTRDATLRTMSPDDFDAVVAVHLRGCWSGTRHACRVMRDQGSGAIINMSSLSGKVGMIGQTNYSAAKAGIVGLTKAAAKEVAHRGIRVNAIQPGLIRSRMAEDMPQHVWDAKIAEVPMGRIGEPEDVADVALFLASDLSSYMTGTTLEVTGGRFP